MPPHQAGIACPGLAGVGRAKGISKKMRCLQLRMGEYLGERNRQEMYIYIHTHTKKEKQLKGQKQAANGNGKALHNRQQPRC